MIRQYGPYLLGYAFVIFVGQWRIAAAVKALWADERRAPGPIFGNLVGLLEGALFLSALLAGHAAVVAVWLGVKVASQYVSWQQVDKRHIFNIHLIGTALSILYAGAGYMIIKRLQEDPPTSVLAGFTGLAEAAVIGLSVVALTEFVRMRAPVIWRQAKRREAKTEPVKHE